MSFRLSRVAGAAARAARPAAPLRQSALLPALAATPSSVRYQSNLPDPKTKAQSILDSLPGNSLVSKAAILSAGAGLSVAAISNELFVVNEEAVVAFCLLTVFTFIGKYGGPMYSEWAQTQVDRIRDVLNAARSDHTQAVKDRIESVRQMEGVVDTTKTLFEISKETAKLEAQAFELEQRTKFVQEAKSVLDSWVRYESQVKQKQQKELAETIIAKVQKDLENPKTLQQILLQSVQEVERILGSQKK